MKIDVEQHEAQVILGGLETLVRHRPAVVVELLAVKGELTSAAAEAHDRLIEAGYESRRLDGRDWLFWHGGVPEIFDERMRAWRAAVQCCVPIDPQTPRGIRRVLRRR